jgi:hypothetical protein
MYFHPIRDVDWMNFSFLQRNFQTIDRIVSSCIRINFKLLKYKIHSKEAKNPPNLMPHHCVPISPSCHCCYHCCHCCLSVLLSHCLASCPCLSLCPVMSLVWCGSWGCHGVVWCPVPLLCWSLLSHSLLTPQAGACGSRGGWVIINST